MNKISKKTVELKVNGKVIQAEIVSSWDYETEPIDEETDEEDVKALQNGSLFSTYVMVKATALGFKAYDSLGQVWLKASRFEEDALEAIKEHDLEANALAQLEIAIMEGYSLLANTLGELKK